MARNLAIFDKAGNTYNLDLAIPPLDLINSLVYKACNGMLIATSFVILKRKWEQSFKTVDPVVPDACLASSLATNPELFSYMAKIPY